jgi:hypothetical protein
MKTYIIEITETLQRQVQVEADSEEDAISKIKNQYFQANIVLDESNYIDTQFDSFRDN